MRRTSLIASLSIAFLVSGCVETSTEGPESEGSPSSEDGGGASAEGVAARGQRGGPREDNGDPVLEIGGVQTEATAGDTVELATREPIPEESGNEAGMDQVEWVPRLTLMFTAAEREGDGVTFHGSGEYLLDEGEYILHTKDFTVLVPNGEAANDVESFAGQFEEYVSDDDEELVTLTADVPEKDFSVTVADVPPEDDALRYEDGTTGRYVQYETPEELWDHEVRAPRDYVPGRLCYVEGEEWHDLPLFDFSDVPCG